MAVHDDAVVGILRQTSSVAQQVGGSLARWTAGAILVAPHDLVSALDHADNSHIALNAIGQRAELAARTRSQEIAALEATGIERYGNANRIVAEERLQLRQLFFRQKITQIASVKFTPASLPEVMARCDSLFKKRRIQNRAHAGPPSFQKRKSR